MFYACFYFYSAFHNLKIGLIFSELASNYMNQTNKLFC